MKGESRVRENGGVKRVWEERGALKGEIVMWLFVFFCYCFQFPQIGTKNLSVPNRSPIFPFLTFAVLDITFFIVYMCTFRVFSLRGIFFPYVSYFLDVLSFFQMAKKKKL